MTLTIAAKYVQNNAATSNSKRPVLVCGLRVTQEQHFDAA